MNAKLILAGIAAILMSATAASAQSITPMREWVPNIDQAANIARGHGAAQDVQPAGKTHPGSAR